MGTSGVGVSDFRKTPRRKTGQSLAGAERNCSPKEKRGAEFGAGNAVALPGTEGAVFSAKSNGVPKLRKKGAAARIVLRPVSWGHSGRRLNSKTELCTYGVSDALGQPGAWLFSLSSVFLGGHVAPLRVASFSPPSLGQAWTLRYETDWGQVRGGKLFRATNMMISRKAKIMVPRTKTRFFLAWMPPR